MDFALCLVLACFSSATAGEDNAHLPRLESAERIVAVKGGGYFPVLIKLQDRMLGAALRGGAPHVGIEGRLDWIHSEDGGRTWSEPSVIVDSEFDDRNPALGQMSDGTIVMSYAEASTYNSDGKFDISVGAYILYYVTSADNGKTWSEKRPSTRWNCPHAGIRGIQYGLCRLVDYTGRHETYIRDLSFH